MFQQAAAAYAATARLTLSGQELEAEALIGAARRLQSILDDWPNRLPDLNGALSDIATVWSIILSGMSSEVATVGAAAQARAKSIMTALTGLIEVPDPNSARKVVSLCLSAARERRNKSLQQDTTKSFPA